MTVLQNIYGVQIASRGVDYILVIHTYYVILEVTLMLIEAAQRITEGTGRIKQQPIKEKPGSDNTGSPLRLVKRSERLQYTPPDQELKNAEEKRKAQEEKQPSESEVIRAAEFLNEFAKVFDFKLQFRVHKDTNRIFSKIIDPETDKVLREIPPEKMLDMAARMQEMLDDMEGILLDCYI